MDLPLLLAVAAMVVFGLVMVYSSSFIFAQERTGSGFTFVKKQLIFAVLGGAGLLALARVPYRFWARHAYPVLLVSCALLALVLVPGLGARVGGAQRWLRFGIFNFQPGELAKFAILVFVARQLEKKQERLQAFVAGVLSPLLVPLPAFLLLLAQPDFGTVAMLTVVILALMFVAGVPKRYLAASVLLLAVAGAWLALGTPYRRDRVMTFLDPWRDPSGKGFQVLQSLVGFQQGGLLGAGLGNSKEKLFFLPEAHNDFIFSVIGEELGFLGVVGLILSYLFFIYRGLKIGLRSYQLRGDRFGLLLATGITLALGLQGLVNASVALGLLPTKGLTLPFVSYGGSALIVDLMAVGLLLSVGRAK